MRKRRKEERRELKLSQALATAVENARRRYYGTLNPEYITELSALENEAVYCAGSTISEMIACFPFNIMERTDRGAVPSREHPVQQLLNHPAGEGSNQNNIDFISAFLLNMLTKGNGLSYQHRHPVTAMTERLELLTGKSEITRNASGEIVYKYRSKEGREIEYSSREVFHIPAISFDGIKGLSPIELFRNNFLESLNADNYITSFYKKGIFSSFVFEFPENAQNIDQKKIGFIKRKFSQIFGGLDNLGEPFIADSGTKIHEFKGATNKEAEIVALRKEAVLKVSRIYKLPPHMLNILDNANYSNVVALNSQFYKVTLLPWIRRFEEAVNNQLIPAYDRERFFCKINAKAILRGADSERAEYYAKMKQLGVLSINEIRDLEDLTRLDAPAADYHMYPANEKPIEGYVKPTEENEDE